MKREASFWNKIEDKKVQCYLCSHNCKIDDGKSGVCGVRRNDEGILYTLIYGSCSSMAADPIEKKLAKKLLNKFLHFISLSSKIYYLLLLFSIFFNKAVLYIKFPVGLY